MLELRFVLSDFTWQALAYILNEQRASILSRFKFKRLASIFKVNDIVMSLSN